MHSQFVSKSACRGRSGASISPTACAGARQQELHGRRRGCAYMLQRPDELVKRPSCQRVAFHDDSGKHTNRAEGRTRRPRAARRLQILKPVPGHPGRWLYRFLTDYDVKDGGACEHIPADPLNVSFMLRSQVNPARSFPPVSCFLSPVSCLNTCLGSKLTVISSESRRNDCEYALITCSD